MIRLFTILTLSVLFPLAYGQDNPAFNQYISPSGYFAVTKPDWPNLRIQDNNDSEGGRVSFLGELGQLFAITYHPLPETYQNLSDTLITEQQELARDKFYSGLLHDFYLPEYFKRANDKAVIKSELFIGKDADRALWATISVPEIYPIKGSSKRLDGKRCVLIFVRHGVIYMLENEAQPFVTQLAAPFAKQSIQTDHATDISASQALLTQFRDAIIFK